MLPFLRLYGFRGLRTVHGTELKDLPQVEQHGQGAALATISSALPPLGVPGGSGRLETPRARGQATGCPATALGARASRLQSRRFHCLWPFRRRADLSLLLSDAASADYFAVLVVMTLWRRWLLQKKGIL